MIGGDGSEETSQLLSRISYPRFPFAGFWQEADFL
jgi:hypothetical protein